MITRTELKEQRAEILNATELFEKTRLRFLLVEAKPKEGFCCTGIETQSNGFKRNVETERIQEVQEISGNKYVARTIMNTYLVDVIM